MTNECSYFKKCDKASKYKSGLETRDKKELQYFLTVCLNGGDENCIKKQKSLDEKIKEE